jgi:hypothetical protein
MLHGWEKLSSSPDGGPFALSPLLEREVEKFFCELVEKYCDHEIRDDPTWRTLCAHLRAHLARFYARKPDFKKAIQEIDAAIEQAGEADSVLLHMKGMIIKREMRRKLKASDWKTGLGMWTSAQPYLYTYQVRSSQGRTEAPFVSREAQAFAATEGRRLLSEILDVALDACDSFTRSRNCMGFREISEHSFFSEVELRIELMEQLAADSSSFELWREEISAHECWLGTDRWRFLLSCPSECNQLMAQATHGSSIDILRPRIHKLCGDPEKVIEAQKAIILLESSDCYSKCNARRQIVSLLAMHSDEHSKAIEQPKAQEVLDYMRCNLSLDSGSDNVDFDVR